MVTICARCSDKEEKTAEAESKWYNVSHWMCPECYKIQMDIVNQVHEVIEV